MKTSHISKKDILRGEQVKGRDIREGLFNFINSEFPDFDQDNFITLDEPKQTRTKR
jgi:hypothetical protein